MVSTTPKPLLPRAEWGHTLYRGWKAAVDSTGGVVETISETVPAFALRVSFLELVPPCLL